MFICFEDRDKIICHYGGSSLIGIEYDFDIRDVPDRCDIIIYGFYVVDSDGLVDSYVMESNKSNI